MKLRKILIFPLLVLLVLYFVIHSLVPYYLEHHYLPKIVQKNGFNLLSLQVDKIGLKKISLSQINIGNSIEDTFSIDSVLLNFNYLLFKEREIKEVILSGVHIFVTEEKSSFSIAGLPNWPNKNPEDSDIESINIQETISQLPVRINKFTILNSSIQFESEGKTHTVFYRVEIDDMDYINASVEGAASVHWEGNQIDLTGTADLSKNYFSADINSEDMQLNLPSKYIPAPDDILGSCIVTTDGHIAGTLFPFAPTYRTNFSFKNIFVQQKDIQFLTDTKVTKLHPVTVEIEGDSNALKATILNLNLQKPYPIIYENVHFLFDFQDDAITANGGAKIQLPLVFDQQTVPDNYVHLSQEIDFTTVHESWQLKTKFTETPRSDTKVQGLSHSFKSVQIHSAVPTLNLTGVGNKDSAEFTFTSQCTDFVLRDSTSSLSTPKSAFKASADTIKAEGRIVVANLTKIPSVQGDIKVSGKNVFFTNDSFAAKTNLLLSTDITYDSSQKNPETILNGHLNIKNATANIPYQDIEITALSASIPFRWPLDLKTLTTGKFALKKIKNKSYNFGDVEGEIELAEAKYTISSRYSSRILENFSAYLNGSIDLSTINKPNANFSLTIPNYAFQSDSEFLKNHSTDLDFSGILDLKAFLDINLNGYSGNGEVTLSDTDIFHKANNMNISGINLQIPIPDINTIKSGTGFLSFDNALFGEMKLHGGKAFFQVESEEALLIERSTLNWAGGLVDILGTRIKKGLEAQHIKLYCNGLNLADILNQSGISSVSGEGTVNGKIPLILEKGKMRFEDAFLYSTPGTGGSIKISNSDILLAGIPKNTTQYSQLDFAGEALKHFKYKWVTLDLKSIQDDAILAMKLEGKPASPLPFTYDSGKGTFIRLPQGSKGIDYPIALDVNFHLPLNKIINYGNSLKKIL